MFRCPACRKGGISPWRKLALSAMVTWPCDACDAELSVPWWDLAVAAVCFVPPLFMPHATLAEIGGTVVYVIVRLYGIPLVVKASVPARPGQPGDDR
jgi:hypothetical protein